ncbi:isocitrate lyase/phosphoenolpyruvate mutase family protein [Bradyrhizobium sp. 186]|nr:isocitrate lyase/phosphoenolpyruvate mutase family protein [Bradyrhizobium sp. 186]
MARTDAISVEGLEAAIDRAGRYADAGADVLFVKASEDTEQMRVMAPPSGSGRAWWILTSRVGKIRTSEFVDRGQRYDPPSQLR